MEYPYICVAILAKQKESMLPSWLKSLEAWDYPKDRMELYIRTNNNTDLTKVILSDWIRDNTGNYGGIVFDSGDIDANIEQYGVHEWNVTRFRALADIRNKSIRYAKDIGAKFYVVVDVDNFVQPHTIRKLVSLNLPVVAPFLKYAPAEGEETHQYYSNYHLLTNQNGYYLDDMRYYQVWRQEVTGHIICDVVHCSYVIRADILPFVDYTDGSDDYEYVIFSRNLRKAGIPQYLDNTEVGGYLTLHENVEAVNQAMKGLTND